MDCTTSALAFDSPAKSAPRSYAALGASLMIIDEWDGRTIAAKRGIRVTGTIGTLAAAAKFRFPDLASSPSQLPALSAPAPRGRSAWRGLLP